MARNWFLAMAAATALWPAGAMAQDHMIRRAESQRETGSLRGAELREALRNRPRQERGRAEDFGRDRSQWREPRDNVRREGRPNRRDWTSETGADRREEARDALRQPRPDQRDWTSDRSAGRRDDTRDVLRRPRPDRRDWTSDRRDDRAVLRDGRRDDARGRLDWQRERARRSQGGYRGRDDRDWGRHDWGRGGYAYGGWNRDWRRDGRYDWRGYRQSNRAIYRLPRYYAPHDMFGGYRRFGVGLTLGPSLFGQDYWLDDPWTYRLPPADGPFRWVRYYNDALLVDLETGEVVDVEHDIFW